VSEVMQAFSSAIAQAIADQRGNSIRWEDVGQLMETTFDIPATDVNFSKVSSRDVNYYTRLNQAGFRKPGLRLGVLVATSDAPFSLSILGRLQVKVSPHPKWPLLVFQEAAPGEFKATDLIKGPANDSAVTRSAQQVWPTINVHEYAMVWGAGPSESAYQELTAANSAPLIHLLSRRKNIVLEGVPGTGKSFAVNAIERDWETCTGRPLAPPHVIVLHPSSAYEDLVEGLRPGHAPSSDADYIAYPESETDTAFHPRLGRFAELCRLAAQRPDTDFLLVLDELNRANVPKALGELMLVIDRSKRAIWQAGKWLAPMDGVCLLSYTGVRFWVPDNVHVLGTMNTTDRSIAPLDVALRRRFDFVRLEPMSAQSLQELFEADGGHDGFVLEVLDVWHELNEGVLRPLIGPDAVLGHSYLFELRTVLHDQPEAVQAELKRAFLLHSLIPQLVESVAMSGREEEIFGGELDSRPTAVQDLDLLLNGFGLAIRLQGDGLGRRVVVTDVQAAAEADLLEDVHQAQ